MVIYDFDVLYSVGRPSKTDAPLDIDPNGVLTQAGAF
jgi:hypothetical protein